MKKKNKSDKKISRSKQKQLLRLIPLGIVLLVMFVFLVGYIIGVGVNKQQNLNKLSVDENLDENISNRPFEDTNNQQNDNNDINLVKEIYFLQDKDGKKFISETLNKNMKYLGKYTCQNLGCGKFQYVPSPTEEQHYIGNDLVIVSEWDGENFKSVVYNYQSNQVMETYDEALCSYEFADGSFSMLVVKNHKMGILSSNGNLVYDIALDVWGYENVLEYNNNVCQKYSTNFYNENKRPGYDGVNGVFTKNNKYGVVNLQTGKTVVDFKYEGIMLMYDGNYSIKEGDKWYLVNNKLEKIIKTGYDIIYSFDQVILVGTEINEDITQYKLVDNEGNDLTNTIDVDFVSVDVYREVSLGTIDLGTIDGGKFTYDLSKKKLNYKNDY